METQAQRSKTIDCEAEYQKVAPSAQKMALEVYDACYRNQSRDINVPLMKLEEPYKPGSSNTLLKSDSAIARLYMNARESMAKVIIPNGGGSGFFLDQDGLFTTGYHVVEENESVFVRTADGKLRKARVIDKEASQDTALLQVEKLSPNEKFKPLKVEPLTDEIRKGAYLLSCGYADRAELHCSPGRYNDYIYQREIIVSPPAPFLSPDRLLGKMFSHSQLGDSGGAIFLVKDGSVRMQVDMTGGDRKTAIGKPAQRIMELQNRNLLYPR